MHMAQQQLIRGPLKTPPIMETTPKVGCTIENEWVFHIICMHSDLLSQ